MKRWLRNWAPLAGALLVALLTLSQYVSRQSPAPAEWTGSLLDTYVRIVVVDGERERAAAAALDALRHTEAMLNRYDPEATVARISQGAGQWVGLDPLTQQALQLLTSPDQAVAESFDIALGQVIDLYGFGQGGRVPAEAELAAALALAGRGAWELDETRGEARVVRAGTILDLGGLHKGLAVDQATAALQARGVTNGLVDAGGNMRALGSRPDGQAWRIGIQHPRQPDAILAVISLRDRAVATSGDYQQFFAEGGIRYHHILDPRTGRPAEGVLSVVVLAPTALEADLLSTVLFVLGPQRGMELTARWPGVDALWVDDHMALTMTPGLQPLVEVQP